MASKSGTNEYVHKTSLARRMMLASRYALRFRQLIWQGDAYFSSLRNAYALRDALCASGPLFVKLGQWMSQRPDLFSPQFTSILAELQSQVPHHSWTETEHALRRAFPQLDDPVLQLFISIERDAIASGSIAQVYRAKARRSVLARYDSSSSSASSSASASSSSASPSPSPRSTAESDEIVDVIVKVRHPNARSEFEEGLDALSVLFSAGRACGILVFSIIRFQDMAHDMMSQLDLAAEASAMRDMSANFANNRYVHFPTPFVATEEVLIESYEPGISYEDIGTARDATKYLNEAEKNLCRDQCKHITLAAYLQMTLHDGFVHGDCHNGNIVYRIRRKTEQEMARERAENGERVEEETKEKRAEEDTKEKRAEEDTKDKRAEEDTKEKRAGINPFDVSLCFLDFGIMLRFNSVVRRNQLRITVNMNANDGAAVADNMRELMIEAGQYNEASYRLFRADCIACIARIDELERKKTPVPLSVVMTRIMELLHKHKLVIDATTGRMMVGFVLIEQGRNNRNYNGISITESTMRWVLFDDAGENFPLVPYIGHVMGAKLTKTQATPVGALPPIVDPTFHRDVLQREEEELATLSLPNALADSFERENVNTALKESCESTTPNTTMTTKNNASQRRRRVTVNKNESH